MPDRTYTFPAPSLTVSAGCALLTAHYLDPAAPPGTMSALTFALTGGEARRLASDIGRLLAGEPIPEEELTLAGGTAVLVCLTDDDRVCFINQTADGLLAVCARVRARRTAVGEARPRPAGNRRERQLTPRASGPRRAHCRRGSGGG